MSSGSEQWQRVDQRPDEPTAGPHRPPRRPIEAKSRCVTSEWCAAPTTSSRRSSPPGPRRSWPASSPAGRSCRCPASPIGVARTARRPGRGRAAPGPPQPVAAVADPARRRSTRPAWWSSGRWRTSAPTWRPCRPPSRGTCSNSQELFACRVLDLTAAGGVHRRAPGPGLRCPGDAAADRGRRGRDDRHDRQTERRAVGGAVPVGRARARPAPRST